MRVPFPTHSAQSMKNLLLSTLAASFLSAGCVSTDAATANESVADREYPTGSNLPRKKNSGTPSGVIVLDKEQIERIRDMQLPPPGRSSP